MANRTWQGDLQMLLWNEPNFEHEAQTQNWRSHGLQWGETRDLSPAHHSEEMQNYNTSNIIFKCESSAGDWKLNTTIAFYFKSTSRCWRRDFPFLLISLMRVNIATLISCSTRLLVSLTSFILKNKQKTMDWLSVTWHFTAKKKNKLTTCFTSNIMKVLVVYTFYREITSHNHICVYLYIYRFIYLYSNHVTMKNLYLML